MTLVPHFYINQKRHCPLIQYTIIPHCSLIRWQFLNRDVNKIKLCTFWSCILQEYVAGFAHSYIQSFNAEYVDFVNKNKMRSGEMLSPSVPDSLIQVD